MNQQPPAQFNSSNVNFPNYQLPKPKPRWNYRRIFITIGAFLLILFSAYALIFKFDFSSEQARRDSASRDGGIALTYAFTGVEEKGSNRIFGNKVENEIKSQLKSQIKNTFTNNAVIASSATYNKTKIYKDDVLDQITDKYLSTVWQDKDFTINTITFERNNDARVKYEVSPINIDQIQQDVQLAVNGELDQYYGDEQRPEASKLILIQLALMVKQWDNQIEISAKNNVTSEKKVKSKFTMKFNKNFRDPYYSVDKKQLITLINAGVSANQKGN